MVIFIRCPESNSLSRREESYKHKLFACLLVCPQGQKHISYRKHQTLDFCVVECWFGDGRGQRGVECSPPPPEVKGTHFRGQKSLSTNVRLSRTASSRKWPTGERPTTNCELSLTIHIEKSNREFKHRHLRPNDYR